MRPMPMNEELSDSLWSVCDLGVDRLERVRLALAQSDRKFLRLAQFSAFLTTLLDEDQAVNLATWVVRFRRIADRAQSSVDEVLTAVKAGAEEYEWPEERILILGSILPHLGRIASDPKVELVIKSSDLYYMHTFHMHELRIVTDIRPVLNDGRDDIDAAIVKNVLMLSYSDGDEEEKTIEIVLSYAEMKRIRTEFDRAISKTDVIEKIISKKLDVPTMIYGSEL